MLHFLQFTLFHTLQAIDKAPSDYENSPNGCSLTSDKDGTDDDLSDMDDFQDEVVHLAGFF